MNKVEEWVKKIKDLEEKGYQNGRSCKLLKDGLKRFYNINYDEVKDKY